MQPQTGVRRRQQKQGAGKFKQQQTQRIAVWQQPAPTQATPAQNRDIFPTKASVGLAWGLVEAGKQQVSGPPPLWVERGMRSTTTPRKAS
ncbi:hypothetical protein KIF59_19560 [Enterobacter cloacae subsp. cloacae]|nr:hypothetical protein [Enterobacter cloacae subsp. cloacae]